MSKPITSSQLPKIAFIVGMGRSGTTLLTNMLNSNPEIIASPENEFILHSYQPFLDKDFSDPLVAEAFIKMFDQNFNKVISVWKPQKELKEDILKLDEKTFSNVCKLSYLNYPLSNKSKESIKYVIDKNPSYSLHIDTLKNIFPEAKFIVIVRDYRDNILSRKKYSDENVPVHKLAADWNFYYDRIFKTLKRLNIAYHLIRYEDLANDPVNSLKELCNYIDIKYSEQMLSFQDLSKELKSHAEKTLPKEKHEKIIRMHSNLDKKVNTERVNAFKNELKPEDIGLLDFVCAEYAAKFRYNKHSPVIKASLKARLLYKYSYLKTSIYYRWIRLRYKLPVFIRPGFSKSRI